VISLVSVGKVVLVIINFSLLSCLFCYNHRCFVFALFTSRSLVLYYTLYIEESVVE